MGELWSQDSSKSMTMRILTYLQPKMAISPIQQHSTTVNNVTTTGIVRGTRRVLDSPDQGQGAPVDLIYLLVLDRYRIAVCVS